MRSLIRLNLLSRRKIPKEINSEPPKVGCYTGKAVNRALRPSLAFVLSVCTFLFVLATFGVRRVRLPGTRTASRTRCRRPARRIPPWGGFGAGFRRCLLMNNLADLG